MLEKRKDHSKQSGIIDLRQEAYVKTTIANGHGRHSMGSVRPTAKEFGASEVPMSKIVAIAASLKAVIIVAAGAVARGDMLPVILISAMFDLGLQSRHKADHREATYIARKAVEISESEPPEQPRKLGRLSPDR